MLKTKKNKVTATILMVVLLMTFSMSALANSGSNSGTLKSNGKTLTHTERYTGTTSMLQAIVSCTGAHSAEVQMDAYYSTSVGGGTIYPGVGNTYQQHIEPGTSAGITYRPQSGSYCYNANARYYIDNVRVWLNTFYGYK